MMQYGQSITTGQWANAAPAPKQGPARLASRLSGAILASVFLGWAAFYLATALCAIGNFAWRQPMSDQWRTYRALLTLPFPWNIVQLENGHRPIVPNLFRLADIHWLHADQLLQIGVGIGCALASVAIIAGVAWRDRTLAPAARAGAAMLAVVGVFWLGNSRILMHGNEALHSFLLVLGVVCAMLFTYRAQRTHELRWAVFAALACTAGMFSYGAGVASFPAVVGLGIVLRLPWRWQLVPIAALGLCLILYLAVLPGDQGVRSVLTLQPVDSLVAMARWISSPWANAWLGLADPQFATISPRVAASNLGSVLLASSRALEGMRAGSWQIASALIGAAGMAYFLGRVAIAWLRRESLVPIQALAIGIGLFVLCSAAIFSIGRLDFLKIHPLQVYADRYLIWACLFWIALALLVLVDATRLAGRWWTAATAYALAAAVPMVLLPTHDNMAGWAAVTYRQSQQLGAAARSGVLDPAVFPDGADASRSDVLATLALLKQERMAMFADPAWERVGTQWSGSIERSNRIAVDVRWLAPVVDPVTGKTAARVEGWVTDGVARAQRAGQLALLDQNGLIAGLAEYSFISPTAEPLILRAPRKRGFDGYIRQFDPAATYALFLLDFAHNRGTKLATLGASAPVPEAAGQPGH